VTAETISSDDKLFGQIVVKNRLASRDDVSRVLTNLVDMQRGGVSTVSLGELFIMEGLLTQKQVEAVEDLSRAIKQVGGYELKKKIGEGGMGQVYAAYQPALDRKVAIKILPRELVDDPSMVRRFQREAKAAAELNHENVIPVYDFGRMGEEYYLVMEYVEGRNLEEILDRQGDIRPDIALKITKQVARALQHAHSHGITHRDMKPNNIMITKEGKAKLADLGLAKRLDGNSGNITQTGVIVGTPAFMAPEQITNPKGVDLRTDIYGLAGKSAIPEEIRGCHPAVAQLIHKMTAANPDDRHPSADEVLIDIKRAERALKNKNPDIDTDPTGGSGGDDGDGKYTAPFENPETMDSSQMIQVLMPDPGPNPWLLWGGVGLGVIALIGVLWLLLG
jgi:serine/threonine protein kinase